MKIKEALNREIQKLKSAKIEDAISKARRLLTYTIDVEKEYLIINNEQELSDENVKRYGMNIERLIEGEPIQYIIGKQEFMGIEFNVNKNVLIPQPDTEILVEKAIEIIKTYKAPKILDLCTGSGAIAISIKKYVPEAKVFASDVSKKALEVAKTNDRENKITFIHSNLFENIQEKFDVIISNPPYIKTEEIGTLSKEVQNEPKLALDGGQDGLEFYRKIIEQAYKYLTPNGSLCLEIGEDQKHTVANIINESGKYKKIKAYKDLENRDRVLICYYSD